MATFKRMGDNLLNGTVLGVLFGFLVASSNLLWIQSIITSIVNIIPVTYHFQYMEYFIMAGLFGIIGYLIDRR